MKNKKLSRDEQHAIREWLKGDPTACPFEKLRIQTVRTFMAKHGYYPWTTFSDDPFCGICNTMFPRRGRRCPCDKYKHAYVTRKARIALARKGNLGKRKKEVEK